MVTVLQKKFLVQRMNFHEFATTVFNLRMLYGLDILQLTEEKEKSGSVFYWVIQKNLLRVHDIVRSGICMAIMSHVSVILLIIRQRIRVTFG